ncbi:MAG: GNAT family N-acetyltransferase, partial [Pseudomonadota bacterium]
ALLADPPRRGTGRALLGEAMGAAPGRLWLVTTNDNLDALGFYQAMGFRLARLHAGAVAADRALKPEMPERGAHGLPIRDYLELDWHP